MLREKKFSEYELLMMESVSPHSRYVPKLFPGSSHAWAISRLTHWHAHERILDIGVGSGVMGIELKNRGFKHLCGVEIDSETRARAETLGCYEIVAESVHNPKVGNGYGHALLLDVLEHLQDPVLALRNAAQCLTATGKIIFTVPAYPFLFSDWDERLGHFRRYTASTLQLHAREAGLRVVKLSHWNSFTLPAACVLRVIRKVFPSPTGTEFPKVSPWVNRTLIQVAEMEKRLSDKLDIPFGLSLVGVLAK